LARNPFFGAERAFFAFPVLSSKVFPGRTGTKEGGRMIAVNGKSVADAKGLTLAAFLVREGYALSRVAVERNGAVVPRAQYESVALKDGDVVEVVGFVGGG
jgi:sulfur carrier protein